MHLSQPLDRSGMWKKIGEMDLDEALACTTQSVLDSRGTTTTRCTKDRSCPTVLPQLLGMESLSEYRILCKISIEIH